MTALLTLLALLAPAPSPSLTPHAVVKLQVEALKTNDTPKPDAGIAQVWAFASPGNKAQTGPLERFVRMVHNPMYAPMLNYRRVQYGPMKVFGDEARQVVILEPAKGPAVGFLFILSKQPAGSPRAGCWMTDAVIRMADEAAPKTITI